MSTRRMTRILCAAEPRGCGPALDRLLEVAAQRDVDGLALVGDLAVGATYRDLFRTLAGAGRPTYWVPGPGDAPLSTYLREAQNIEVAYPFVRGVHGTATFAPGEQLLVAGLGGEISDDPDAPRDEVRRLRYPRWEAEYRLKLVGDLGEHERVLLFWTRPAHKGLGAPGSAALAELVSTHRPRLVVCGGEPGTETLGRSLVVAPGPLREGHYAVADVRTREAELDDLSTAVG
jgi:Icc-related predicted phosphoesterase